MNLSEFVSLSDTLPYWPTQLFSEPDFLDEIGVAHCSLVDSKNALTFNGTLIWVREIVAGVPGLEGLSIALLSTGGHTEVPFEIDLVPDIGVRLTQITFSFRFTSELLKPVQLQNGKWVVQHDAQGNVEPAEIVLGGVGLNIDSGGDFKLLMPSGAPALSLGPTQIGESGLVVEIDELSPYFYRGQVRPAGLPADFRGFTADSIKLYLPSDLDIPLAPQSLTFTDVRIGTGGFSGKMDGQWTPTFNAGTGAYENDGAGTLFGIPFGLTSLSFEFKQNTLVGSELKGELVMPFFDQRVAVDLSIGSDGSISLAMSAVQPSPTTMTNGLLTFEKSDVLRLELDSLGFELKNGVFVAKLSGQLTPLAGGIAWPSFDVRDLSIDSDGHVHLEGGWMPLPKSYSIDFHGAKLEITKFGMGKTDDGGKYVGMSGAIELVEGMPAGASVEGLKIVWHPTGTPTMTLNGIGLKFQTPAMSFDGHVSYALVNGDHQFKGDLTVVIPAANDLTLIGKAVFGKVNGNKYFAIYIEGEFGTGIPLASTGVALYGIAGLVAVNYAPDKPGTMLWYSVDHANSYFHKPQTGVTDIVHKWKPEAGTFAIGGGIRMGTLTDGGYAFNGKFLLLLLCPGPVLMIDGSAAVLRRLSDQSEPPFHGLIVWDNKAGYFMVGLDARWKKDPQQGDVADISGSMEAYFNFHDPRQWHLWLGKKDPTTQRIQARFARAFTANSYFMLDARQLAVGVWIGSSQHYNWGPVGADLDAWMAADAVVNFKPSHFHANIEFYGHFAIKVFKFHLAIGMDANLSADVATPFHIKGELDITIETRIKDFDIHMELEWGPRVVPPELNVPNLDPVDGHVPELAVVQSWGIAHSKSANEWPLQLPQAAKPVVPVDSQPYFTFAFPMHDLHGVGVNPSVPTPEWNIVGDPSGGGSAQAKFALTAITLYRVNGANEIAIAAHPKPANAPPGFGDIYGAWAPTVPGTSGGQNKLMLWSANPLDFTDNSGSWNPWLSSNLPGYPCPDVKPQTICMDFEDFDLGRQIYGSGWHTPNLDFRLAWSDVGPHPVLAQSPIVEKLDRGLLFSAPKSRAHSRAYVSNFGDNTVSLVDLPTRNVVATIPAGLHPRQVVLSPDGKRAHVCNQDDNSFIVIDTATNRRVGAPIAVIKSPVSIAISRDGKLAFVPSGTEPAMSVIDLQSLKVTSVKLSAVANQAVLSPDGSKLYVMHGPAGEIAIFDTSSIALIKTLAAADGPAAMVFHPSAPRAWISFPSRGTVRLFDTSGDELTALETQTGKFARDLALSPEGGRLYVGNLQGNTVSVLDTVTLDVLATIPTPGPAGLRMTPDGTALLVANYFANTIAVIDPVQNQVVEQGIAAGQGSNSFAVLQASPRMLYRALVTHQTDNTVSVLDLQTGQTVRSIPVGRNPRAISLAPNGQRAFVCNQDDSTVTVIDAATYTTVGAPIPVAASPDSIAITPDGERAFVMSGVEAKLSVIDLALTQVIATVALPDRGNSVILSADGKKGYAIVGPAHMVAIFSLDTLTVTKVVAARSGPQYMALHPSQPRAYISFPDEGAVREFDTNNDQFTGVVVDTGTWAQNLCFSPDGSHLYVCNLHNNTISVVDSATNTVVATISNLPLPMSPVFTSDGSRLVVASYTGSTVALIDPVSNLILGNPIPSPSFPNWLVLQGTAQREEPLWPIPVDVMIDVPSGSSTVEVRWTGRGPLRGMVSSPSAQTSETVAAAGSILKLDVAVLDQAGTGLALSGIDQIRLRCDSEWTLLRVCATRLPFAGGLAALQTLNSAFHQQVDVLTKPTFLLDPEQEYKVRLEWSASVQGLSDLQNWSESFASFTDLRFTTTLPPSLEKVSDPNVPPKTPSTVKGLDDLSLYVRGTIPVTQNSKDQIPVLSKPNFCGYDVTVEFNESYVDQLYLMAGRDLDLLLFDRNNEAVRDALGQLIIVEDAWDNAPTLKLTDTQALWIDMFNANTCGLTHIDPATIPTSKVLRANDGHILAPDSVYEARLVPQLVHQTQIAAACWTADPLAGGARIYNPGTPPAWTDYRVSVLVTLATSDPVGILFGHTSNGYYEFGIDPGSKRRRLTQVSGGTTTTIREDYYVYDPGHDDPYRIRIEAVGSRILISQNGAVVFTVVNAAALTGTMGLRQPVGQDVFADIGVSNLAPAAPVAYRFHFTTSKYTNFYHQVHSFQDRTWMLDQPTPLNLSAAVSSLPNGQLPCAPPTQTVTENEVSAYDNLTSGVLGPASAQDPPQLEVTRLEQANAILGWLVRGPEPVDYTRAEITLSAAPRRLAHGVAPGAVKIAEAELGDAESVTLLAREAIDLSGYRVEYRQMPSALADELGGQMLRQGDGPSIASSEPWTDYRARVVCSANLAGGIGIQFRYVDDQNFYAFTFDFTTGVHSVVRTENGVSTELSSVTGDPAPGIPDAPAITLTVSVLDSQIKCYRAGQMVLQTSDSTLPFGGAGVFSAGNSSAQFDSFEVYRLPNESYAQLLGPYSTGTTSGWVTATDGSGLMLNVVDATIWTNAILRARMKENASGTMGLLFRYQDPSNHYRLLFTNMGRSLERVAGGVVTVLWRSALSTAMNQPNEIAVLMLDSSLSVFQDSIPTCEVVDASLTSGCMGLCMGSGADFVVSQLIVYPPEFAFSSWTMQDEFLEQVADRWTPVDQGDQNGPSNWQVANGRLTQTSAILDSSSDPIRRQGTLALCTDTQLAGNRLVMRLLTAQAGDIGVVFGYQDADNFCRLSMSATADSNTQRRRLVQCVNGTMTVLWADSVVFHPGRDYLLTLDLIDDGAAAWLDGEPMFRCGFHESIAGSFGLYCCANAGASFGNFRVGAAAWIPYYQFGHESPLSAGNRMKIASAVAAAPNRRTSVRLAAELDDTAVDRLPPAGAHLRVTAPDRTVLHSREFIPAAEFANIPFKALRKSDGTGIFLAPVSSVTGDQTARLSFQYHRDNGVVAFSEFGESGDELVFIDLPAG
jgi:YVTN family beta-propeller protein